MRTATLCQTRRWCREVASVRSTLTHLLTAGYALTDPYVVRLSRRLDRLAVEAIHSGMHAGGSPHVDDAFRRPVQAPATSEARRGGVTAAARCTTAARAAEA